MNNYLIGIFNINKVITYYHVPNKNSNQDAINSLKFHIKNDLLSKYENEKILEKEINNMFDKNNFVIFKLNSEEIQKI